MFGGPGGPDTARPSRQTLGKEKSPRPANDRRSAQKGIPRTHAVAVKPRERVAEPDKETPSEAVGGFLYDGEGGIRTETLNPPKR